MPFPPRPWINAELESLSATVARFIADEITPNIKSWSAQGYIDRRLWLKAGELGLLCTDVSADEGGIGGDISHEAVISMDLVRGGGNCFRACRSIHVIAAHYLEAYGTPAQKARWLPGLCSGELVAGMAMTEPGGGSDLQNARTKAVRCQGGYLINGSKTFITNGSTADLLVVALKTDPKEKARGCRFSSSTPRRRAFAWGSGWTRWACTIPTPANCSSTIARCRRRLCSAGSRGEVSIR
ncbi:acyl-CoA dehydrogenase family protein [Oleomonas cavernae]|uniref:acyl-CoA dehydrogenase family protein n=1 Tax=Oleomonas cavernae TaxID=2320859 RepID=UPI0018F2C5B6|nr:acyl-CoA dehydrogenase family protein [Oleomonas cavernae]